MIWLAINNLLLGLLKQYGLKIDQNISTQDHLIYLLIIFEYKYFNSNFFCLKLKIYLLFLFYKIF